MADHSSKYGEFGSRSAFLFHELLKKDMQNADGRKFFKKGETIFEENNHANGLFCVISGKVKIVRLGESGKEQIVRLAGKLDVIGYRALLADENYHGSAIALEDTMVGFIPKKIFFEILTSSPEMSMQMMRLLSQDLDHSEIKRVDIATKTVKERVAELLLLLKETYGVMEDGATLDIKLSRDDLAAMIGAAKEVVIRALAQLKEEHLIESRGREIKLVDIRGLIRIAKLTE
jgi:CRP/FNR family transcriptional regulator, polysaccharide utilization system transcription regulator